MTTIANTQTQSRPDTTVTSANLQKLGGWSGIISGSTCIFVFAMFVTVFSPLLSG